MVRGILAILAVGWTATLASLAADEYAPVPNQPPIRRAPRLISPPRPVYSLGTPSAHRPPLPAQVGHAGRRAIHNRAAASAGGWTGYGFGGIPTYQWGSFGVRHRPMKIYHRGYYGDRTSFGYRRGY